jgi:hypothetical protein
MARRSSHAPGVDVPGLCADDRRHARRGGQRRLERRRIHLAVAERRHLLDRSVAEPEQAKRPVDSGVPLDARHDPHLRRAGQAVTAGIPAVVCEHVRPAGGQADGVGRPGAGDKPHGCRGRQPEQLFQPSPGDVLERDGRGRERGVERVLIPAGREQVGDERRVDRAADDKPEEPRPGSADESRRRTGDELVDDAGQRHRAVRQIGVERGGHVLAGRGRADAGAGGFAAVGCDRVGRAVKGGLQVVHAAIVEHPRSGACGVGASRS